MQTTEVKIALDLTVRRLILYFYAKHSVEPSIIYNYITSYESFSVAVSQNRLKKIKEEDFPEALPIFNFCRVMNKNAYFFFYLHPRCHGNRDFLFFAYFCIFFKLNNAVYQKHCISKINFNGLYFQKNCF